MGCVGGATGLEAAAGLGWGCCCWPPNWFPKKTNWDLTGSSRRRRVARVGRMMNFITAPLWREDGLVVTTRDGSPCPVLYSRRAGPPPQQQASNNTTAVVVVVIRLQHSTSSVVPNSNPYRANVTIFKRNSAILADNKNIINEIMLIYWYFCT